MRLLAVAAVLAGAATAAMAAPAATSAAAQSAREQVREAGERARAAGVEEQRLAQERVAAAERLRGIEAEVDRRAADVSALSDERAAAEVRLRQHAAALGPLLPLMERLALFPAETLLAVPGPPEDALRGLGILHGMAGALERDAAALRREQAELDARAAALHAALPRLQAAEAEQAEQAGALDRQLATARALRQAQEKLGERAGEQAALEAQRQAAADAARAESLRGAVAALEAGRARAQAQAREDAARAERQRQTEAAGEARLREAALARPPGLGPGSGDARGQLIAPVAGSVVRAWGEPTEAGPATGISFRPAPQARVVAPCGGRVRFAGPFRSFGALVILDCGGGFAFVLAGLERVDVPVGAAVLPGEPVGIMPGWTPGGGSRPALYLELRRDGQAVNPAPFLHGQG